MSDNEDIEDESLLEVFADEIAAGNLAATLEDLMSACEISVDEFTEASEDDKAAKLLEIRDGLELLMKKAKEADL